MLLLEWKKKLFEINRKKSICEYSTQNIPEDESYLAVLCCENKNVRVLKYILDKGYPWSYRVCEIAAKNNSVDILRFVLGNMEKYKSTYVETPNNKFNKFNEINNSDICDIAAENGNYEALCVAVEYNCFNTRINDKTGKIWTNIALPAKGGNLDCIKLYIKYGADINENNFDFYYRREIGICNNECLEYLVKHKKYVPNWTDVCVAMENNNIKCLRKLVNEYNFFSQDYQFSVNDVYRIDESMAISANIEIAQMFIDNGYEIDSLSGYDVLHRCNLEFIKFYNEKIPFINYADVDTIFDSIFDPENKNKDIIDCVTYIAKYTDHKPSDFKKCILDFAVRCNYEIVDWCIEEFNCIVTQSVLAETMLNANFDVLQHLYNKY